MLIRILSPDHGTRRIECSPDETTESFIKKVSEAFGFNSIYSFCLYRNRNKRDIIPALDHKSLADYSVQHGDMLYLEQKDDVVENVDESTTASSTSSSSAAPIGGQTISGRIHGVPVDDTLPTWALNLLHKAASGELKNGTSSSSSGQKVKPKSIEEIKQSRALDEDEVDRRLAKLDGLIERGKDALCRHGSNAKCVHCTPLEPYDEGYLKENNIKHLSFHAFIRKNTNGIDKGKFTQFEDISCKIKTGCTDHLPWPQAICSSCQPSAITLNRQPYRHVDNVMFENAQIVDRFLNYWRLTGMQRVGFLYGKYEEAENVPLGIRAKVLVIYEPPQEATRDSLKILPDPQMSLVDEIAAKLELRRIGWIFTDLVPDDLQKGTVRYTRNEKSYFLSARECLTAAVLQNLHPNPCRLSPKGVFGSKFVTVCVTGDKENQVHMEGYQVSNQCMALVRDKCFVPTEAPEFGYVIESSNERYVPDVFYKMKDEYGNEVQRVARPLPVEYLLVQVPVTTPAEPHHFFNPLVRLDAFPIENRLVDSQIQSFNSVATYLGQFNLDLSFMEAASDFHFLVYLAHMDTLPMRSVMDDLLDAVKRKDRQATNQWRSSEQWQTLETLIAATTGPGHPDDANAPAEPQDDDVEMEEATWSCAHCTFGGNPAGTQSCQLCMLPKSQ